MRQILLAAAAMFSMVGIAAADCNDTIDTYNQALSEIEYQVGRYVRCVGDSMGNDDCYSEFRRLKNAQSDFESAVSEYRNECD